MVPQKELFVTQAELLLMHYVIGVNRPHIPFEVGAAVEHDAIGQFVDRVAGVIWRNQNIPPGPIARAIYHRRGALLPSGVGTCPPIFSGQFLKADIVDTVIGLRGLDRIDGEEGEVCDQSRQNEEQIH